MLPRIKASSISVTRTTVCSTNKITRTLNINASILSSDPQSSKEQFTYLESQFTSTRALKLILTNKNTEIANLTQTQMQLEILKLLPKFLNSHKAYLSNSLDNSQQIYINSRDDKEVQKFAQLFSEAGFSGKITKAVEKSTVKAGHSIIHLDTSLPELLQRLRDGVKAQEANEKNQPNLNNQRKCKL
jgi:septum formation topological specificity factor MinE